MPPKPRNPENDGLVSNLYCRNGYYSYRDPRNGREFGIGRDRAEALDQAIEANRELLGRGSLLERATTPPKGRTLADFEETYKAILKARTLAPQTRQGKESMVRRIFAGLGKTPVGPKQEDAVEITKRTADWIRDTYTVEGKHRTAINVKSAISDIYAEMGAAGWLAVNPIDIIRLQTAKATRQRLTLDHFRRIWEVAGTMHPWVRDSMAVAIVTLQRREDVAGMQFGHEVEDKLEVIQSKSQGKTRLRIPTRLRLEALGWSVSDVIARCRNNVVSRHLIHHTTHRGKTKPGRRVTPSTLSTAFAECRDIAQIELEPGKTPTSFHELRSLGGRLYEEQGYDPQLLLGHKEASTTAIYLDVRGIKWIEVAA